jgi:hypothetical protein
MAYYPQFSEPWQSVWCLALVRRMLTLRQCDRPTVRDVLSAFFDRSGRPDPSAHGEVTIPSSSGCDADDFVP